MPRILTLPVSPDIGQGQTVVVTYTDPTAGDDAVALEDAAGNETHTFTTSMPGVPAVINNTAATGAPSISGTAESGHVLTAAAGTIADADGLSGVHYTYQWVRVDADGTSNPTPISGATYATYALTADDEGKRVKVQVSFIDDLGNGETRTSAAYPSSGTVAAGSCPAPDLDGRSRVWTGMLAVGPIHVQRSMAIQGYGFQTGGNSNPGGALNPTQFNVGPNGYMIDEASVFNDGNLRFSLTSSLTAAQRAVLRLHVCDTDYDFSSATHNSSGHSYFWDEGLDWSSESTRTLHLSLETIVNRAATGAPTISGLPAVGHRLSAGIAGIADEDGLPSSFTYQWLQVDADGTSNEEAISGANAATYTVAATDVGKRVKVRVSFIDDLGGGETLTSDAFPLSGTVYMAVVPEAPQNITASTANTRVVLGWEAPANDGGAPITKYQYRASADSGTSWSPDWTDVADGSDAGSDVSDERGVTVTGLTNGTGYTFEVRAVNSAGGGAVATATANPGAVCAAPDFGTRRNFWTGTVEVEAVRSGVILLGYGFALPGAGSLADNTFSVGANAYTVDAAFVGVLGSSNRDPIFSLTSDLTSAEVAALKLHACDTGYDFADATHTSSTHSYQFDGDLDWSMESTRTLYLSLPANNAATGEPTITGTAQVGQELTADASPIIDTDGLTDVDLHLPVDPGGLGRRLQRGGYFRRDRRDLHPDERRRGQEGEGEGELHRQSERRGDTH